MPPVPESDVEVALDSPFPITPGGEHNGRWLFLWWPTAGYVSIGRDPEICTGEEGNTIVSYQWLEEELIVPGEAEFAEVLPLCQAFYQEHCPAPDRRPLRPEHICWLPVSEQPKAYAPGSSLESGWYFCWYPKLGVVDAYREQGGELSELRADNFVGVLDHDGNEQKLLEMLTTFAEQHG